MTELERIRELDTELWTLFKEGKSSRVWGKTAKFGDQLVISVNKANHVYWDYDGWIYDEVAKIDQHMELTGQERTAKFVESISRLHGCVVTEDEAGFNLEVFTPYKVYLYRFNRGYGDYPIRISRGYIAPGGNTYVNCIFVAKDAADMKARYHTHKGWLD